MTGRLDSEVIIIGGGATGAVSPATAPGADYERCSLSAMISPTGATGRNHGLLHSGARYAVTDNESARECISENRILRRIARHCIEPTNGLFITLPEDDLAWQQTFIDACQQAGIEATPLSPQEALRREPAVNPTLLGAVQSRTVPSTRFASPRPICSTPANTARRSLPAAK